jgi:hypothetical protein
VSAESDRTCQGEPWRHKSDVVWNLAVGTEENHKYPQPGYPVTEPTVEPMNSPTHGRTGSDLKH